MSSDQLVEIEAIARAGGSDPVLTIHLVNEVRRLQQERADLLGVLADPAGIKHWRQRRQLTLRQLAARVGVTLNYLSKIELGEGRPSLALMSQLINALGICHEPV